MEDKDETHLQRGKRKMCLICTIVVIWHLQLLTSLYNLFSGIWTLAGVWSPSDQMGLNNNVSHSLSSCFLIFLQASPGRPLIRSPQWKILRTTQRSSDVAIYSDWMWKALCLSCSPDGFCMHPTQTSHWHKLGRQAPLLFPQPYCLL